MNDIQIFENEQFGQIRVIEKDGAPWFVVNDVCEHFGVSNRNRVMQDIDEHEKGGTQMNTPGGIQTVAIVSEAGLYELLFALRPTKARGVSNEYIERRIEQLRRFKRWVTSEVLPAIRKHGAYMTDETLKKTLTSPDFIIQLATELKHEQEARAALEVKVTADAPKVEFADAIITSETSISIGRLAKLITQGTGIEIGQKRLFAWMRDNGWLIRSGADRNKPTQRSMRMELFEVRQRTVKRGGQWQIFSTTRATGKGQQFFINKFLHPEVKGYLA